MRAGRMLGLVHNLKGIGGGAPLHEDFTVRECAVGLETEAVGPADEDGDAVTMHILHGLTVERPVARDNHAGKVPGLANLTKRAPKQLEEDVGTVLLVAGNDFLKNGVNFGGIFVERPVSILRKMQDTRGRDHVRAVRKHVVERWNRHFDSVFGALSCREGLTVTI